MLNKLIFKNAVCFRANQKYFCLRPFSRIGLRNLIDLKETSKPVLFNRVYTVLCVPHTKRKLPGQSDEKVAGNSEIPAKVRTDLPRRPFFCLYPDMIEFCFDCCRTPITSGHSCESVPPMQYFTV